MKIIDKKTGLFLILGGIFITNAIVAELVGGKIFSLENTFGFAPAQLSLGGSRWDFNLTAGVILWPVVFITTDIINEYFGKEGVKKISYFTVILILYVFLAVYAITWLAPADFWLNANATDDKGNPLNINYAFNVIFTQGLWIIGGSVIAFIIGQLMDAFVFHKVRNITGEKYLWIRATGSTLISQLIDSFIVLIIAFYISGQLSFVEVISIGIVNYTYKFLIAVVITPLLYIIHDLIDKYLGKELSGEMMKTASKESQSFF